MLVCAVPGFGDVACDNQWLTSSLLRQLSEHRSPSAFLQHTSSLLSPGPGTEPIGLAVTKAGHGQRWRSPAAGLPPGGGRWRPKAASGAGFGCMLDTRGTAPGHTPLRSVNSFSFKLLWHKLIAGSHRRRISLGLLLWICKTCPLVVSILGTTYRSSNAPIAQLWLQTEESLT